MADACIHLLELPDNALDGVLRSSNPPLVNIGLGKDSTISELAALIRDTVGSGARIV